MFTWLKDWWTDVKVAWNVYLARRNAPKYGR